METPQHHRPTTDLIGRVFRPQGRWQATACGGAGQSAACHALSQEPGTAVDVTGLAFTGAS